MKHEEDFVSTINIAVNTSDDGLGLDQFGSNDHEIFSSNDLQRVNETAEAWIVSIHLIDS